MPQQLCQAITPNGDKCYNFALSNGFCRLHGGAETPDNAGRYAQTLPHDLWQTFRASLEDGDQLHLRNEIALLDSIAQDFLTKINGNFKDNLPKLLRIVSERRRLVESERQAVWTDNQVMTREQAVFLIGKLLLSIRQHITDQVVLQHIATDFDKLMEANPQPPEPSEP